MSWSKALPWALALWCAAAGAGPLAELAGADPAERAGLIESWAPRPDAERRAAVAALEQGRLLQSADGLRVLWQRPDGALGDAVSGQPAAGDAASLEPLPLNNRLRGALAVFHAVDELAAADPGRRLAAVRALADSGNPALLPLLRERLAREGDAELRRALERAGARLSLSSPDPAQRRAAAMALADSGDPAALALLAPLTDAAAENDAEVRAAAMRAQAAIRASVRIDNLLGAAFAGLSLGSVLLLAALGLAVTYGLLGVINMAHGEMLMLGAYVAYAAQSLFHSRWPAAADAYLALALPAAFLLTAAVGMALERLVIRHLYGRPLETLLATWGISLVLMQLVRTLFGAQNVAVANPGWLNGGWALSPALTLPYNRIAVILFSALTLGLVWLALNRSRLGLFVRAVTQNRRMADSLGVATGRVDMLAFGLGSGIAGLGGVALSQIGNVGPDLGQGYIVDSFMVVVLGGVGQLAGAAWGALGLGVANKLLEPALGAVLGKILILAGIILFIQKRPQGLFALKGRAVD